MRWEALLVTLIPLAVWILSTIFRGREEEQKQQERLRRPRSGGDRPRSPRRGTTELDRFLEEARERRKVEQRPARQDRQSPGVLDAIPVERPMERPRERAPRDTERRPRPRIAGAEVPLAQPVKPLLAQPVAPSALPAPEPPTVPAPDQLPLPEMRMPTQNPQGTPARAAQVIVPATQPRRPSPTGAMLIEMLKDRKSLAAAVMLREVFDRPLSQRRRRGSA